MVIKNITLLFINLWKLLEKKAKSIYNNIMLEKGVSVRTEEKMEVKKWQQEKKIYGYC